MEGIFGKLDLVKNGFRDWRASDDQVNPDSAVIGQVIAHMRRIGTA